MKEITNVLKSKQFLIGLGVGFAGYWAYNKYMGKEATSSASGVSGQNTSCWSVGLSEGTACQTACEEANGTYDSTYNGGQGGCLNHSPSFSSKDKKMRISRSY